MSAPNKRAAYEPGTALLRPPPRNPHMRRPVTTVAGASLVLLRAAIGLVSIVLAVIDGALAEIDTVGVPVGAGRAIALGLIGVVLGVQVVLGILIFTGHNLARVYVMLIATIDITIVFIGWVDRGGLLRLETAPYTLALDILVLLALSSRSAAAYARRNQPEPGAARPDRSSIG